MSSPPAAFDYIIVGGGTAGVVIASRLKQYLPASSIALLEAGPNAIDNATVNNPSAFLDLAKEGLLVDYSTAPQVHCNNRSIPNLAGRMLSGSSGGNSGVWMRASATDYALMAEKAGHSRFAFENILRYIKRVETWWNEGADREYVGFEGPVHTTGGRNYPLRQHVLQSAEKMGLNYNENALEGDPTGLTDFVQCYRETGPATAARQHSARVYDLSHVDVRCDTPVARILLDNDKRAIGVELVSGEQLFAKKEVIMACGTQRTPQLLMLSGIGPKNELEKHGIPVKIDSPSVGQNLFDHTCLFQYYKLKDPSKGYALPFVGTARPEYGQGSPCDFVIFSNSTPSTITSVLESDGIDIENNGLPHPHLRERRCHTMNLPIYFSILGTEYNAIIAPLDGVHIATASLNLLPLSRGTVSLRSSDPKDTPFVNPNFLSTQYDRFAMRTAVRTSIKLISTSPFADVIECETPPGKEGFPVLTVESSDEQIDARVREFLGTFFHPMGSCALGTVLDNEFRVKGVSGGNLRVCDASVFPEPLGAMPSCTVYALAEMCADLIAGRS